MQEALMSWVSRRGKALQMHVSEMTWPNVVGLEVFDRRVELVIDGYKVGGRGRSRSEKSAFKKACGEALERFIVQWARDHADEREKKKAKATVATKCSTSLPATNSITSNGWAVHSTRIQAANGAVLELIERDLILSHAILGRAWQEVRPKDLVLRQSSDWLTPFGAELKVGALTHPPGPHVYVCAVFGERARPHPFGFAFGSGASFDKKAALMQAVLECMTNVVAFKLESEAHGGAVCASRQGLMSRPVIQHKVHAWNSLETEHMRRLFHPSDYQLSSADKIRELIHSTNIQQISLPPQFTDLELYTFCAENPRMQQLFFGPTRPEFINRERLSELLGRSLQASDYEDALNRLHPIG